MATKQRYSNLNQLDSSGHDNGGTHEWVTETGRGEGCQRCHRQIDLCRILGANGRVMTLCDDCRAIHMDGGVRQ